MRTSTSPNACLKQPPPDVRYTVSLLGGAELCSSAARDTSFNATWKGGGSRGTLGSPVLGVQDVYANFDIPERVLEAAAS
jgi:hypothetical protein